MLRVIVLPIILASSMSAQTDRESYWSLYQTWRQLAPALEETASAPSATFAEQVRASSDAAKTFLNARAASLLTPYPSAAEYTAWAAKPLTNAEALLTQPQEVQQLLAVTAAKVGSDINGLAAPAEKDPAIRRFRQSIERERAALRALMDTLAAGKTQLTQLLDASDEAEVQRALTGQALASAAGRRTQLAEHVKREADDWAIYYKDLFEGASASRVLTSGLGPVPLNAPGAAPAKITRPNPNGPTASARYTGEWIFPTKGLFYGKKPDSVELVIQESNGVLSGALNAHYAEPPGELKFDFKGSISDSKTQTFTVPLANGATGSVELIPGTAINLLEINFESPAGSTPVNTANFVLVKR